MEENYLINYQGVDVCHGDLVILHNVQWKIAQGEFIYLLGKVGSGKSSLLKTLYGEIPVEEGEAHIFDYNLSRIKRRQIPLLRRKIGIIFQDFQLLADRSVYDNLVFVLKATGWKNKQEISEQVLQVLQQVGMEHAKYKFPHQLSGGEQQRVVIARALLNSPELILADEPTGNVDMETGEKLMALLHEIHRAGTTVIVATHNVRWVELFPGRIFHCTTQKLEGQKSTDIEDESATQTEEPSEIEEIVPDETSNLHSALSELEEQAESDSDTKPSEESISE
ncbi:ATP-binding cassette domain-containing protein [Microbacter margulisiae]|uniref:Cell division transport system ATP-binding protein n=1 Tax=Microbacter margulisiae TaxID=1350067 RepID=A0A7W5DSL9_9PORP|nr:cell division transport system ATP-binding protein [Microbacter margulisiae]